MSDWSGQSSSNETAVLSKLSDDFDDFCNVQITIYPYVSKNKFGEITYGSGISTMGIALEVQEQIFDKENKPVVSNSQLFIDGNVAIELNSKVLFNGKTPEILKIAKIPDENGTYTKIIYL